MDDTPEETYLLDTNIISDLADETKPRHLACMERLKAVHRARAGILLPVMSIAEIEFGLHKGGRPNSAEAHGIRAFFAKWPLHIPFDDDAVQAYALLRSRIWHMHGPSKKRPEEWTDRVTGKELGIDERDLIIASVAVLYNCVLVTDDSNEGMRRIREAADELAKAGHAVELRMENWRRTPG